MSDVAISVHHVTKDFKLPHGRPATLKAAFTGVLRGKKTANYIERQHALKDINFEVKKGEFFGIVGRNGSGKSTLLKILAGIYQPTKGNVDVDGKLVPFIELGVGFNPELTGRENVYLNGALLGFSAKEIDGMYEDIVEFAELERFMDQKLKNYSSGMQVRLAFSMATRAKADILLVDEVLAVGDADFQRKCFNHFKKLKKENKTVVFVSHDMSAIREYCDRAIMIEQSELIHAGSADEVAVEYIKLFNAPKKPAGATSRDEDGRWGDQIVELKTVKATMEKNNLTVDITASASGDSAEPVFGYLIKDAAGNELIGSNTKIKKLKTGNLKEGDTIKLRWKIPNVFNDGIFFLTIAVSHDDGVTQHDWWDNAASFQVFREDKTPYALNPQATVEIIK